jgi:general secretion pathway protein A
MYEAFFGLQKLPFRLAPDPSFIYFSKQHREVMNHFEYALLHDAAFCLVTGDVGSGKTTLIRYLLKALGSRFQVGVIADTSRDIQQMMEWVCEAFGLPVEGVSAVGLRRQFRNFLLQLQAEKRRALLIVDEAQNLGRRNLEELRLLSNINAEDDMLLQVIIVGQPELRTLLTDPRLTQVAQRVSIQIHLGPLNAEETAEFVRHRVRVAGGPDDLFTPNALRLIYLHSRGIPRLVNRLCDIALMHGFGTNETRIGHTAVADAAAANEFG